MYKINNNIPIRTWKELATKVQQLNFSDKSEAEFLNNLQSLKKLLNNTNVELNDGIRVPSKTCEIGLQTFLQTIYDMGEKYTDVKTAFYDKIHQLSELGIKSAKFEYFDFDKNIYHLCHDDGLQDEKESIKKAYTDGVFKLNGPHDILGRKEYGIDNLCLASYILIYVISKNHASKKCNVEMGKAILTDFTGDLPSVNEVKSLSFPKILVPEQTIEWRDNISLMSMDFQRFNDASTYQKVLKK